MQNDKATVFIESAIKKTAEMNPQETDGKWLEVVTVESGPFIKEWDLSKCWHWEDWPERETRFPNTTRLDVGIDAVAVRRGDGKHVAIQCKSRHLDDKGCGASIGSSEISKFAAASSSEIFGLNAGLSPTETIRSPAAQFSRRPCSEQAPQTGQHHQRLAPAAPGECRIRRHIRRVRSTARDPDNAMMRFSRNPACKTKPSPTACAYSRSSKNFPRAAACRKARRAAGLFCPCGTGKDPHIASDH